MKILITLFIVIVFSQLGMAETAPHSENRLNTNELVPAQPVPGDDVDQVLTNKQMRASSGSKSRFSIATGFNYSGGKLVSPFAQDRPNISGATGSTSVAEADGSVSLKYALKTNQALLAGVGVRWITPFQGTQAPSGYSKVDASNPYLNYQYIYKWAGVQSVAQLASTYFTQSNLLDDGYVMSLGLSQNNAIELGHSGVTVGAMAYTGLGFYNKNDLASRRNQSDYSFGFAPFLEYQITERVIFHTGCNLYIFEHVRDESNANTYRWDKVTQNIGLGLSISRDFYLYPNLQFLPDNVSSDKTTVAINGNLNIF